MDATLDEINQIAKFHLEHGTTTLYATTLAAGEETMNALSNLQTHIYNNSKSTIIGINLEGPWLNPKQCGAQNCAYMRNPNKDELIALKKQFPTIKRVCSAPELEGGYEFGRVGKELGIVMSCAHTDGNFSDMQTALNNGYNLMTHLYSGMKGVERKNAFRIAGAVEGGLYADNLFVEIIADGRHLPNSLLKYVVKIQGADRVCLITDGTRGSGKKNGESLILGKKDGGVYAIIEDEVAKLPDRTSFAGSVATADRLFKTMMDAGFEITAVSKMASSTPAKVMSLNDRGEIAVGKRADMLLLSEEYEIEKIIFNGEYV
jgi:N-acetylglucosamine-6-phosphate deacetylase